MRKANLWSHSLINASTWNVLCQRPQSGVPSASRPALPPTSPGSCGTNLRIRGSTAFSAPSARQNREHTLLGGDVICGSNGTGTVYHATLPKPWRPHSISWCKWNADPVPRPRVTPANCPKEERPAMVVWLVDLCPPLPEMPSPLIVRLSANDDRSNGSKCEYSFSEFRMIALRMISGKQR